mgnify:FL=1
MFGLTSSGLVRTFQTILFLDFWGCTLGKTTKQKQQTNTTTRQVVRHRTVFSCWWWVVLFGLTSSFTLQACESCVTVTFLQTTMGLPGGHKQKRKTVNKTALGLSTRTLRPPNATTAGGAGTLCAPP